MNLACEEALWSGKEQKNQRVRTSEETGRGGKGKREREGGEPVDKGLKLPFHPLVIDLSFLSARCNCLWLDVIIKI